MFRKGPKWAARGEGGQSLLGQRALPVGLLQQLEKPDTFFYLWPH